MIDLSALIASPIVGNVFGLLGVLGVSLTLAQAFRLAGELKRRRRRKQLEMVSETPLPQHKKVYGHVLRYHGLDRSGNSQEGWLRIDRDYFMMLQSAGIVNLTANDETQFKFPLVTKQAWLYSHGGGAFSLNRPLLDRPEKHKSNPLLKASKRFMKRFGEESFPIFLKSLGREIWNAPTYDLCTIDENGMCLGFVLGDYYGFVSRNELLMRQAYLHCRFSRSYRETLRRAAGVGDLRTANGLDGPARLLKKNPTKMGISSLLIMKKKCGGYAVFLHKRGLKVVEEPDLYHVVPAGTFQPYSAFDRSTIEAQFCFEYTILRELLEEVFDLEAADRGNWADPFRIFKLKCGGEGNRFCPGELLVQNEALQKASDSNQGPCRFETCLQPSVEIRITGLVFDLVGLKPQLIAVTVVKDPELYDRGHAALAANWEAEIKQFNLDEGGEPGEELQRFLRENLSVDRFLPTGAVALAEGPRFFKQDRDNARISEPS